MYKTEYTWISTLFSIVTALVFSGVVWLLLSRVFNMGNTLAVPSAIIIGGIEYFVFRYILSQKYYSMSDDD